MATIIHLAHIAVIRVVIILVAALLVIRDITIIMVIMPINQKLVTFLFKQRASLALCLIVLLSCSVPSRHQWEFQEIVTAFPRFNGGKAILGPSSSHSHLEIEIQRNSSGLRFYVNLLFLQALPKLDDPSRTSLEILFENQEPWIIDAYLLAGGQRLLLPGEVADVLIQNLLNESSFILKMGRSQIEVLPDHFLSAYTRLLNVPIDEKIFINESDDEVKI